jgi:hypothetical protein
MLKFHSDENRYSFNTTGFRFLPTSIKYIKQDQTTELGFGSTPEAQISIAPKTVAQISRS